MASPHPDPGLARGARRHLSRYRPRASAFRSSAPAALPATPDGSPPSPYAAGSPADAPPGRTGVGDRGATGGDASVRPRGAIGATRVGPKTTLARHPLARHCLTRHSLPRDSLSRRSLPRRTLPRWYADSPRTRPPALVPVTSVPATPDLTTRHTSWAGARSELATTAAAQHRAPQRHRGRGRSRCRTSDSDRSQARYRGLPARPGRGRCRGGGGVLGGCRGGIGIRIAHGGLLGRRVTTYPHHPRDDPCAQPVTTLSELSEMHHRQSTGIPQSPTARLPGGPS
jgi:hypothetical protein